MAQFLAEPVELSSLSRPQECARVEAGGRVALDEDLVSAAGIVQAAEEVVEADLIQMR